MVKTKHMNEDLFSKTLKELNVASELVRARQDEKQGLLDEFDKECKRFFFGKISRKALQSSVNKTNRELSRLDRQIRTNMVRSRNAGNRALREVAAQAPIGFRATMSGIVGGGMKKKKMKRRMPAKKMKKTKRKAAKRTRKKRR